jgi:hypothetical protein
LFKKERYKLNSENIEDLDYGLSESFVCLEGSYMGLIQNKAKDGNTTSAAINR